ncbi:rhomboid-related protein 4 isoform X1 [Lingula anatina]|uniref:Rhomboid-related protein 4 isoform X1 n=1 Tax=Lingula anatina TaxID=7574 RepID=A0A1S3IFX1_LINAN|nr:rhomboid-related protein 4 isoform X1 [Lingula anatina]|eukprot:XP_013396369.1 rhomboid-related protein 4 isoform X1 [Lingula anatina]
MFRGSRQRRGPGLGLMLLVMQLLNVGLDNIPPVTLATIFGNTAVFLGLFDLKYPSIGQVCVSVVNVWYRKDWQRLLLAAFFHAHEWHLYYNMVSFLWKGISLEKRLGSLYFAYLIAVFSVLVNCTLLLLDTAVANIYENDHYLSTCAVGFSGVIFALKVVTTYYLPPGIQYVMGIPVPSRVACWVELGVIQLLVPNASFTGHLAGILVGLAYMKGPLKSIMDSIISPADARRFTPTSRASGWRQFRGQGSNQGQGYNLGGSGESYNSNLYTGGLTEEEQYRRAMEESMADSIQVVPVTHYTDDGAEEDQHVTTGQSADDASNNSTERQNGSPRPSTTPQASASTGRLLSPDELRQRRLAKLEKDQLSQQRSQTSQQSKAGVSRLPVKRKT